MDRRRPTTALLQMLLWAGVVAIALFVAAPPASADSDALEVSDLSVTPGVIASGDVVTLDAVIRNLGPYPVTGLRIAVAVTDDIAGRTKWNVVESNARIVPALLAPGEATRFHALVRLTGDGWLQVGVAALADNAALPPQGVRVRVVDLATLLPDALLLLLVNTVLIAVGARAIAVVWGGPGGRLAPTRGPLIGAALLALLGLALLASNRSIDTGAFRAWSPLAGTACLAISWIAAGAGLRPRGSGGRGAALAAVLYAVVGLVWVSDYNAALGLPVVRTLSDPSSLLIAAAWPLQLAQVLGILGLTIG